jgi:shikimate kinase
MARLNHQAIRQKSPLIVELVGLAGTGKTTLARALSQRDEKIRVATDLELRKKEHLPIFIGHTPFLLPLFFRRCRSSRRFTWDEIKAMVYLKAWPRVLKAQTTDSHTTILLDQGPVFKLATLNAFGPKSLKSQGFEPWWRSIFEQWACILDVVIWLKAPSAILVERINTRSKRHAIKGKPDREAGKFLRDYQASYQQVLDKLTAQGALTLRQFDTNQAPLEQIVDEVLATFKVRRG